MKPVSESTKLTHQTKEFCQKTFKLTKTFAGHCYKGTKYTESLAIFWRMPELFTVKSNVTEIKKAPPACLEHSSMNAEAKLKSDCDLVLDAFGTVDLGFVDTFALVSGFGNMLRFAMFLIALSINGFEISDTTPISPSGSIKYPPKKSMHGVYIFGNTLIFIIDKIIENAVATGLHKKAKGSLQNFYNHKSVATLSSHALKSLSFLSFYGAKEMGSYGLFPKNLAGYSDEVSENLENALRVFTFMSCLCYLVDIALTLNIYSKGNLVASDPKKLIVLNRKLCREGVKRNLIQFAAVASPAVSTGISYFDFKPTLLSICLFSTVRLLGLPLYIYLARSGNMIQVIQAARESKDGQMKALGVQIKCIGTYTVEQGV